MDESLYYDLINDIMDLKCNCGSKYRWEWLQQEDTSQMLLLKEKRQRLNNESMESAKRDANQTWTDAWQAHGDSNLSP
jgi:hypothetical protein